MKNSEKIKIIIVDDHPVVRKGMSQLLNQENWIEVIGQAADAKEAMSIIQHTRPDLMIIDITLQGLDGLQLTKDILIRDPEINILVMSMHDENAFAERALLAGARGYIMKQVGTEEVVKAIRMIMDGFYYLSSNFTTTLITKYLQGDSEHTDNTIHNLTDRELNVFELIGQGFSNREIAQELFLSVKTIESHREKIKKKLRLKNSIELLRNATQWVEQSVHVSPKR